VNEKRAFTPPSEDPESERSPRAPRPVEQLAHYFAVFTNSPDAIILVDGEGTIREINRAAEQLLGYSRGELAGESVELLVPQALRSAHRRERNEFKSDPVARHGNRRLTALTKEGEQLSVEIHLGPTSVGDSTWVIATLHDMREQIDAEHALVESEARFRSAFENASIGMAILDVNGAVLQINGALLRMLGYQQDEIVGHSFLEFAHPDERIETQSATRDLIAGVVESIAWNRRHLRKDGSTIWTHVSTSIFRPSVDSPPQVFVLFQDITERREAAERLRRSEQKYARIFDTSPLAITVSTLNDGVFREANPSCRLVFGYSRDELIGHSSLDLSLWVDPADREEMVRRIREKGSVSPLSTHFRKGDGSIVPVELFAASYEVDGVEYLMGLTMDVSERVAFETQLERQALYDGVTGLPNRSLFHQRLQEALEAKSELRLITAVVAINLDRFKVINETTGHGAGDDLLLSVSNRLRDVVKAPHTVARFSADEFYVLLDGVAKADEVVTIVRHCLSIFESPFRLLGTEVHMTASAGIALSAVKFGKAEELMRQANLALSLAKGNPDLEFHLFDPKEDVEITDRFRRETQLWKALDRDEFRLYFQPVFNLVTEEIVGAEALVRWQHPTDGLLNPGEFIPIAEESALIISISEWVKTAAARQAAELIRESKRTNFVMSVNVSARHFMRPYLVQKVQSMLKDVGLPARNFEIEVTETVVLRSPEQVEALRDIGVHIAVDDLGTGFSSLEYLTQMNVDTLKVDRVLTERIGSDPRSTAVVEAIRLIGERLAVRVIAEGIETQRQLSVLRNLGYEYGQGFLLGRPMRIDQFRALLDGNGK